VSCSLLSQADGSEMLGHNLFCISISRLKLEGMRMMMAIIPFEAKEEERKTMMTQLEIMTAKIDVVPKNLKTYLSLMRYFYKGNVPKRKDTGMISLLLQGQ